MNLRLLSFGLVGFIAITTGCAKSGSTTEPSPSLTPARQIQGTWKSQFPITFSYITDYCTSSRAIYSSAQWNITWNIVPIAGTTNGVEIEMRYTRTPTVIVPQAPCREDAWVPLTSPTFIRAVVSSSSISRASDDANRGLIFDGNLTTSNIAARWWRVDCVIYCSGETVQTTKDGTTQEYNLIMVRN